MQTKTVLWLAIFSMAMGYMESAVVIYLRKIYYPDGFHFPLRPLDANIGLVELFREAATLIMLLGIAILSAKTASMKFASFLFCFAIWDLFYYIFLWIFLGWPVSLFTWDILFLIPVPWVGPVITPCIISLTMIALALSIIYFQRLGFNTRLNVREWMLFSIGSFVVILSFIWDYLRYMHQKAAEISDGHGLLSEMKDYVPSEFNWMLFFVGEFILLLGILLFVSRIKGRRMALNLSSR